MCVRVRACDTSPYAQYRYGHLGSTLASCPDYKVCVLVSRLAYALKGVLLGPLPSVWIMQVCVSIIFSIPNYYKQTIHDYKCYVHCC